MPRHAEPAPRADLPDAPRKPGTIAAMSSRTLSPLDRLLVDAQNALGTVAGKPLARRAQPGAGHAGSGAGRRRAPPRRRPDAHQPRRRGLRPGRCISARPPSPATRRPANTCSRPPRKKPITWPGARDRLRELDSRPSLFNPLWYAGSYSLGRAGRVARRRLEPGLRGRNRAPGRGAPGRTPADPAGSRPAQPRDPARR